MGRYIGKRLLIGIITLFALMTITFFLMHVIPGSPFTGEMEKLPPATKETLIAKYNLDKPITQQYISYLRNVLRGDFGTSLNRKGREVTDIIADGIGTTASLGAAAFVFSILMGITLGTISALSQKRWISGAVALATTIGISVPGFLLALLMMRLFGVALGWLPIVGLSTWKHYILPCIALSLGPIAMISRLVSTGLSEALQQDYMIMAKSKGTGWVRCLFHHALKNASLPVITYGGPLLATLLTGSFVVESLFSVPGIGAEFVNSVSNRDYTLIMALTILYGTMIIVVNIITDIITAAMDPRIRLK